MNLLRNTAKFAMSITADYINKGDTVVDATVGNGNDALALSRLVGETGKVYGFDIQPLALMRASEFLMQNEAPSEIELVYNGHEEMDRHISEEVSAIVFNLGYLPSGEKQITTTADTTITALDKAIDMIKADGIVTVVMYPGHPAGQIEKDKVLEWGNSLDKGIYHCAYISMINQPENAPCIMLVTKKKQGKYNETYQKEY